MYDLFPFVHTSDMQFFCLFLILSLCSPSLACITGEKLIFCTAGLATERKVYERGTFLDVSYVNKSPTFLSDILQRIGRHFGYRKAIVDSIFYCRIVDVVFCVHKKTVVELKFQTKENYSGFQFSVVGFMWQIQ